MSRQTRLFSLSLAASLLVVPFALTQGAKVSSPIELAHRADTLKPGEWVWAPEISPAGPVLIYVDLSRQLATVYRNGIRIGVSTISSGMKSHATPTGVFTILQKNAKHRSNIYNNAPMPYMQRLTWSGVALHAGNLPGYPQSHGCIRLPYNFSKELFKITSLGGTIVVEGNAASKVTTMHGSTLSPLDVTGQKVVRQPLEEGEFRWQPELSPKGPLSIIISKTDQRLIVLRNGIEIGRSVIHVDPIDDQPRVVTLTKAGDGTLQWIYVGLPGSDADKGNIVDENTLNRVHMPRLFYEVLKPELQPGTSVLVTMSHITAETTGKKLTIIDAVAPTK